MRKGSRGSAVALFLVVLLGGVSLGVVWRQSRALEVLRALDDIRREAAVVEAERVRLNGHVQTLESRSRVVAAAGARLGMRVPSVLDLALLPWDAGWAVEEPVSLPTRGNAVRWLSSQFRVGRRDRSPSTAGGRQSGRTVARRLASGFEVGA